MHAHMQPNPAARVYGAIEAGGTKFVCAMAEENGTVLAEQRLVAAALGGRAGALVLALAAASGA